MQKSNGTNLSEGQLGKFIKMYATSSPVPVCYKAVKKAN